MKIFITYLFLFSAILTASAQSELYQVYKTWQDYKAGKPVYTTEKLKLHHVFARNYVDIIKDNAKIRLYKDSIFGYTDSKHNAYRFYKTYDKEYKIEEDNRIVIYTSYLTQYTSQGRPKCVLTYFFSAGLNMPVYPLTVLNLKRAFPGNIKFHDMLDVAFGNGTPPYAYDAEHKMYKINFLLSNSLTNP